MNPPFSLKTIIQKLLAMGVINFCETINEERITLGSLDKNSMSWFNHIFQTDFSEIKPVGKPLEFTSPSE